MYQFLAGIEVLPNSDALYGEIIRDARLRTTLVGTSVADDERAFSCMAFMKATCIHVFKKTQPFVFA
jgi:hypothetical protein